MRALQDKSQLWDHGPVANCSIVILNWNGKHLLAEAIPAVLAAVEFTGGGHEVIVVDNGSSDGSPDYVRHGFPSVKVVALARNMRFSAGNNAGACAARREILVFLNNDMVVERDFLPPLLSHFDDPRVFAAACRIVMPQVELRGHRGRETGLTRGEFHQGFLQIDHEERLPPAPAPVLYAGGGSCACDRARFLAIGGFDTLWDPFYWEDVDLSYRARKRGWEIVFEPRSVVHHKHRATNNPRNFPGNFIPLAEKKNSILFMWKNVSDRRILLQHFRCLWRELANPGSDPLLAPAFFWALRQLPQALARRIAERPHWRLSDAEVVAQSVAK